MKPKFRVILEQAIEEGIKIGWNRAHKHTEKPEDYVIQDRIFNSVISQLYEYFTFDNEL